MHQTEDSLTSEENIGLRELEKQYPRLSAPLKDRLEIARAIGLVPAAPRFRLVGGTGRSDSNT